MQLGFIGTGEITSSIVTGLSSSGVTAHSIWLSPRNSAIAKGVPMVSVEYPSRPVTRKFSTIPTQS
jgi:pyrroline-5-carboxylate reductase